MELWPIYCWSYAAVNNSAEALDHAADTQSVDVCVIGSGAGGSVAASELVRQGLAGPSP